MQSITKPQVEYIILKMADIVKENRELRQEVLSLHKTIDEYARCLEKYQMQELERGRQ